MFTFQKLAQPQSVDEAYEILAAARSNAVLGGCGFLRLGARRIGTAIDLSRCGLDVIEETADEIIIGAMTTYRTVETSQLLASHFNGVIPRAVSYILGVQFRNSVTVGASVFAKYGFSDFIPVLLTLDTDVQLHMGGRLPLAAFLPQRYRNDILTKVIIKKNARTASYQEMRNSHCDFPLLTTAASELDGAWRIVVGARPGRARFARRAAELLTAGGTDPDTIAAAADMAAAELPFETNSRATAAYRQALCQSLVRRAVMEVLSCK